MNNIGDVDKKKERDADFEDAGFEAPSPPPVGYSFPSSADDKTPFPLPPNESAAHNKNAPCRESMQLASDEALNNPFKADVEKSAMIPVQVQKRAAGTAAIKKAAKGKPSLWDLVLIEATAEPPRRRLPITFDYEQGQYLGAVFSSRLGVLDVDQRPGISPIWDKIKLSDIVRQVGNVKVSSKAELLQCLRTQQSPITFFVERFITIHRLTSARAKWNNVDLKTCNDVLLTTYLLHRKNAKLGFSVKPIGNMVIIMRVEEGLAYGILETGDIILDINGVKVTNCDQAKQLLQHSLKKNAIASLAIKRPMTADTLNKVATVINDTSDDPEMQIDAILIGRMEACKRHMNLRNKPKNKVLVKRSRKNTNIVISLDKNVNEDIHSEVEAKEWDDLQTIPPRMDFSSIQNNPKSATLKKRFKLLMDKFF